jgi:hypothetical protein
MKFKRILAVAIAAFLALSATGAFAGNTSLWSSTLGDVLFPFTAPSNSGITPGSIDNMTIGATTPAAGHFTTLSSTSSFSGPVVATTLSASGAVSGTGFSTYLASPPAIGGTAPAAGTFTTDKAASFFGTGAAPAVTGTGTPTIVAASTDTAGEVTAGASGTSVVITFAVAKTNAPFCVVTPQTGGIVSFAYTISTTAITITQTATSGDLIDYVCVQH